MGLIRNALGIYKAFRPKKDRLMYHPDARYGVYLCNACTWFPEGPWTEGCEQHDLDYHNGGTKQDRLDADRRLREYFAAVGYPKLGQAVFLAVRGLAGKKFRWAESIKVRSDIVLGKYQTKIDYAELRRVRSMPAYIEQWGRDNLEDFLLAKTPYGQNVPATAVA